jgi:hypothetical protein
VSAFPCGQQSGLWTTAITGTFACHGGPVTTPELASVPVRSSLALTRRWVALLAPPVFGARSLWLTWLGTSGLMLPLVIPIDDVPPVPEEFALRGLLQMHETIAEQRDVTHLALALCRPGEANPSEDDEAWAQFLRDGLDDQIDETWSLHLAAGGSVRPMVDLPA